MKWDIAEQFVVWTLQNTRLYKENGKYYVSSTFPDLPAGFEMFYSFGMERTNAPVISYKTNALRADALIPKTGSFTRELSGLSSVNDVRAVLIGISIEAPAATIHDFRKYEGALELQAEFRNGSIWLWDVYVSFTAGGSKQLTHDQNKLFQW
jgi:hypothetical protein